MPLKALECAHRLAVALPLGDRFDLGGQLGTSAFQLLQASEVAVEGLTVEITVELHSRQPVFVLHRPGTSLVIADAAPQKKVQDALLALA